MSTEHLTIQTANNNVSRNLRWLRKLHGMTMKQVAEALGIKPNTYRIWETDGKSGVKINHIIELSDIFGVTTDFLLTYHSDQELKTAETHHVSSRSADKIDSVYGDKYFTELGDYEKIFVMQMRRLSSADRKKVNELIGSLLDQAEMHNSDDNK